tara:strand:- start:261 stop:428 length:168 start_codon:yes stop_codon:yes gene_type:complete
MAERGWGFLEFFFVTGWLWAIYTTSSATTRHLESIDEKMHTHDADGSIQGIRGWY